jgi:hypothetical protein
MRLTLCALRSVVSDDLSPIFTSTKFSRATSKDMEVESGPWAKKKGSPPGVGDLRTS